MAYFHNGLVFSESCVIGFCQPNNQSGAVHAAMMYNATRFPCNSPPPPPPPPPLPVYHCSRPPPPPTTTTGGGLFFAGYPPPPGSGGGGQDAALDTAAAATSLQPQDLALQRLPGVACELTAAAAAAGKGSFAGGGSGMFVSSDADGMMMTMNPVWRGDLLAAAAGMGFSQRHLDMALYGYANSVQEEEEAEEEKRKKKKKTSAAAHGYALSGIKSSELSYGIDRLLGNDVTTERTKSQNEQLQTFDSKNLNLPDGLGLFRTEIGGVLHCGIVCVKPLIPRSTRFGPFCGRLVDPNEVKGHGDNNFLWEVFSHGVLSHFIDGSSRHWMTYVNCARTSDEQNLIVVQLKGKIHYEACRDIHQGTELLVWYGDAYLKFMGIPVSLKPTVEAEEQDANEGYQCQRCGKVFAYQYYREKHLKYTRCVDQGDRKFPCPLCTRSFEKRDRLRIHILHVHEKHRPHKCTLCSKSFSQSSSLNKHMRVHSGERPYKCAYCSKAFTASSILRTHVRQHSGEKPFKCKYCGKAFASHAAHDSHVKRTHNNDNACSVCGRSFDDVILLRLHSCVRLGVAPPPPPPPKKLAFEANPDRRQMMSSISSSGVVIGPCEELDVAASSRVDGSQTLPQAVPRNSLKQPKRNGKERIKYEDEIDVVGFDFTAQEETI